MIRSLFRLAPLPALFLGFVAGLARAADQNPLPPLDRLLCETHAQCELDEQESGDKPVWPLTSLAHAYAYSGDYERAIQTAQSTGGLWGDVGISICLGLQMQLTGNAPEIPPGLSDDAALLVHQKLATLHADAGRIAAAFEVVGRIPVNRGTAFILAESYLQIARKQLDRGEADAARETLTLARKAALEIPPSTRQLQQVLPIVELLVEVGDRETALEVTRKTESAVLRYLRNTGIHKSSAIMWAQLGMACAILGESAAAETAFQRAVEFAAAAGVSDKYTKGDGRLTARSDAFAEIAALQRSVGRAKEADSSLRRAVRFAERMTDAGQRPFQISKISQVQLKAGHRDAALAVASQIEDRYYHSFCLCRLAEERIERSELDVARQLLTQAQRLADTEPDPDRRMQILIQLAEAQGKAGEPDSARENFERAANIAQAIDEGYYQLISRAQIRADLLPDAWSMLNRIEERQWRVLPLAELTLAVAKRDHAAGPAKNTEEQRRHP